MPFLQKVADKLFPCAARVNAAVLEQTQACDKACEELRQAGHALVDGLKKNKKGAHHA